MTEHPDTTSIARAVQYCDMDSSVMGIHVARIVAARPGFEMPDIDARHGPLAEIDLIYWISGDFSLPHGGPIVRSHTTHLCATNIKYTLPLPTMRAKIAGGLPEIFTYDLNKSNPEFDRLARECNHYSHLKNDPRVHAKIADRIYSLWMHNSATGLSAEKIFVARRGEKIQGMITCSLFGEITHISLIAVDRRIRGKGIGTKLINTVISYAIGQGCNSIEVVTQINNFPACRLYEKCGFKSGSSYHQYHLWNR